jgi:hypothetical protein
VVGDGRDIGAGLLDRDATAGGGAFWDSPMELAATEEGLALRASRFVKAELKRAGLTYAGLAERLNAHGLTSEIEPSIKAKLRRGTFTATFLLAALDMEGNAAGGFVGAIYSR